MKKLIATIPKRLGEEIRVALDEFEAGGTVYDMVSARVWFEDGPEWRPGRNGINVKVGLLPALIEALTEAEREARRAGFIPAESDATK